VNYSVGGPDASYTIGGSAAAPPLVPGSEGTNAGAYGVVHHVAFTLVNNTTQPAIVYLYETAHGGPVRASYVIDGSPVTAGCARVPQPYLISVVTREPSAQRVVSVMTMADGGSNFPLEVGATQALPFVNTPPQNAPDGCFPKSP